MTKTRSPSSAKLEPNENSHSCCLLHDSASDDDSCNQVQQGDVGEIDVQEPQQDVTSRPHRFLSPDHGVQEFGGFRRAFSPQKMALWIRMIELSGFNKRSAKSPKNMLCQDFAMDVTKIT